MKTDLAASEMRKPNLLAGPKCSRPSSLLFQLEATTAAASLKHSGGSFGLLTGNGNAVTGGIMSRDDDRGFLTTLVVPSPPRASFWAYGSWRAFREAKASFCVRMCEICSAHKARYNDAIQSVKLMPQSEKSLGRTGAWEFSSWLVAGARSDHNLRPEQVKMVAGGRTHHNLRSDGRPMKSADTNEVARQITVIVDKFTDLSFLFRSAA